MVILQIATQDDANNDHLKISGGMWANSIHDLLNGKDPGPVDA